MIINKLSMLEAFGLICNGVKEEFMRRGVLPANSIVALLVLTLFVPLTAANSSSITTDTVWSGNVVLDEDIIIAAGSTLTIEPGTVVDGGEGFTIEVSGSLQAESVHFLSTATPATQSSHGQGLWQGIIVNPTGSVSLDDVVIDNSNIGVKSEGDLLIDRVTIADSYLGIYNSGVADVTGLTTDSIDYEAILNRGTLSLHSSTINNASTGVMSSGTVSIEDCNFTQLGSAISLTSGATVVRGVDMQNVSVALTSVSGVSADVSNVTGSNITLFADMGDSDNFVLSSVNISGGLLATSNSVVKTELYNISFEVTDTNPNPVLRQSCVGLCLVDNVTITNAGKGILFDGDGQFHVRNSTIVATEYGIRSSNEGVLLLDNTTVNVESNGIVIRDTTTKFSGLNRVITTTSNSVGIDILGGSHDLGQLEISKQFDNTDTSSVGCQIWYAQVILDHLITNNFSTGVTMRNAQLTADTIANIGGKLIGTEIIESMVTVTTLSTKYQDSGIILADNAALSVYQYDAQLHDQPLYVGLDTTANVLQFNSLNTNPAYSDATGDGAVYYGYAANLAIDSAISNYFELTPVKFIDTSGNPIQAAINTNTFQFTSDENGMASIPLFPEGSDVQASLAGTGITQRLFGGVLDQEVEIPIIPTGDWVISGNQIITLESLDSTQLFTGNLVLQDNAILQVIDMSLELGPDKVVTLSNNAQLVGANSSIIADLVYVNDSGTISGSIGDAELTVASNVEWNCIGPRAVANLRLNGSLLVGTDCDLVIQNGFVTGGLVVTGAASFQIISSLTITVVNRGVPVSNAVINFQNSNYYTDTSGTVVIEAIARLVDAQSDFTGSNENVLLQMNELNELITWNTTTAKSHQFVVSDLAVDEILSGDIVLEPTWSPYYLDEDLIIPLGRTMSILDGVSVRVSDGVKISVLGSLNIDSATVSSTGFGARWAGIVTESQYANVALSGATLLEASPVISYSGGILTAEEVVIARAASSRALIEINEQIGGAFSITNAQLSDASSACVDIISSTIEIHLENISLSRCNGPALRAENARINATELLINAGSSNGLMLTDVKGEIENIDATEFNGAGSIVKLDYINEALSVRNLDGRVGGAAGINGANNRALDLESITIRGAPGIDFDSSAGSLTNITLIGQGFGTAFTSHHGRYSDSLKLTDVEVYDYAVGFDLHADGPETTAALEITDAIISASTSLSIENYPVVFSNASLAGVIEASGAISIVLVDVEIDQQPVIYDDTVLIFYRTIELQSSYRDFVKPTTYVITAQYSDNSLEVVEVSGSYAQARVKFQTLAAQPQIAVDLVSIDITANSLGHPSVKASLNLIELSDSDWKLAFGLSENKPPEINSVMPKETTPIMQTIPFSSIINASDDNDASNELFYLWSIIDETGSEVYSHSSHNSAHEITMSLPGSYLMRVTVLDTNLAQSEMIVPIEVALLDSDHDYITTCDDNTWFDLAASRACGPDVYDDDDDNDGIIDSRDMWPTDPCAWQDTDSDGQPDNVDCPEGETTVLFADQDDDGDGIPDSLEGTANDSNGPFNLFTIVLLVIGIIMLVVFLTRTKRTLQE